MRVVVTGMGALSCAGADVAALREALRASRSGLRAFGPGRAGYPAAGVAGCVDGFGDGLDAATAAVPRGQRFLNQVVAEAISQAGLDAAVGELDEARAWIGSIHGHLDRWCAQRDAADGDDRGLAAPWDLGEPLALHGLPARRTTLVSTACTASTVAVGMALDALRQGAIELAIVGGFEVMTPFLHDGFVSLRALSPECRPFDARRNGLVLGEGAAALVLETEAHARRRGATPLAEVAGYGFGLDVVNLTAPDPTGKGAARAIRQALDDAGLSGAPDHVNAHGTGTRHNDPMEAAALRRALGSDAARVPVTSTKPFMGHLCGAAGATELVCAIEGLRGGFLPATLGLEVPDPKLADLDFVRGAARDHRHDTVLSMNSGFGGTNAAVLVRRIPSWN